MNYTIAIGADHRGFHLKEYLCTVSEFGGHTITWQNVGTYTDERTDYPIYAHKVVGLMLQREVQLGVLICGSGIGESIAANRFRGIYAGLVWNEKVAHFAKAHDNVNLLILPADYISNGEAEACITAWLSAEFLKGRYQERLTMIDEYLETKKGRA